MSNITLLVADDEPIVRAFIKKVVKENQLPVATIVEACNGEEAVALAETHMPDLLLLDIRMPGLNGLEAAKQILQKRPTTHVVIVTAYDDFDYVRIALRSGVADYLLKPIGQAAIASLIAATVERKQAHDNTEAPSPATEHPTLMAITQYIASNLDTPLLLENIAESVFMSPSYCSRVFKKLSGQSLTEYIARERVKKTKELLLTTYLSITEVAGKVGFNNAAYFTAWFKKQTGKTPMGYRKKQ